MLYTTCTNMGAMLPSLLLLSIWIKYGLQEEVLGVLDDEFDFDGLPGANHEFKMTVPAGGQECFYMPMKVSAELHVSYDVLKGADRNVDMVIKKPSGEIFASELWKSDGSVSKEATEEGPYEICIDNTFSRFSSKLVYIYIVSYSWQDWDAYAEDIKQLELTVGNFSQSISKVSKAISDTQRFQAISRQTVMRDWYLIKGNNKFINYWSIFQIIITMCTAAIQVYFLRRLFESKNVTPTSKPRA